MKCGRLVLAKLSGLRFALFNKKGRKEVERGERLGNKLADKRIKERAHGKSQKITKEICKLLLKEWQTSVFLYSIEVGMSIKYDSKLVQYIRTLHDKELTNLCLYPIIC